MVAQYCFVQRCAAPIFADMVHLCASLQQLRGNQKHVEKCFTLRMGVCKFWMQQLRNAKQCTRKLCCTSFATAVCPLDEATIRGVHPHSSCGSRNEYKALLGTLLRTSCKNAHDWDGDGGNNVVNKRQADLRSIERHCWRWQPYISSAG